MSTTVAVANQKGGIGKTTTTLALGAAFADRGQRVLLVDLDPQGSLSMAAGFEPDRLDQTVYTVMTDYLKTFEAVPLEPVVQTVSAGLHLLPANIDLAAAEFELVTAVRREYVLANVLAVAAPIYDLIVIDCPPSLGLLTINALTAATAVVIPVIPEYLAVRGLGALLQSISQVRRTGLNPDLTVAGTIFTMVTPRLTHGRQIMESVREHLSADAPVLGAIKRSVRVAEASEQGVPLPRYAAARDVAQAYGEIADRLLDSWMLPRPVAVPTGALASAEASHE